MFPNTGWSRHGKGVVPARHNQPASQKNNFTVSKYSSYCSKTGITLTISPLCLPGKAAFLCPKSAF